MKVDYTSDSYDFRQVFRPAMALGDSRVAMPEHGSDWAANDIATTKNDCARTSDGHAG